MTPMLGIMSSSTLSGLYWYAYLADSYTTQGTYTNGITKDSSDNLYATGIFKNSSGAGKQFITKYNSLGVIQWSRSLSGSGSTVATAITSDSSGNNYTTGYFTNASGGINLSLVKYNSSGALQWQRSIADSQAGASQNDIGWDIVLDSSAANVYVTGSVYNGTISPIFIAKYNSSGAIQYQRQALNATSTDGGNGNEITMDSSNNYYCAGLIYVGGAQAGFLLKYNSSDVLQWQSFLTKGSSLIEIYSVDVSDDNASVYVGGFVANASSGTNGFVAKYDSSGTLQWSRTLSGTPAAASQQDRINKVMEYNGYVYAVGITKITGGTNGFIAKYNSSGTLQWQRSLSNTGTPSMDACDITINSIGNICIGGRNNLVGISGINAMNLILPNDGSRAGTFTIDANHTVVYAASSLTDAAGALTSAAGATTITTTTFTDAAGSFTDASLSLSNGKVSV